MDYTRRNVLGKGASLALAGLTLPAGLTLTGTAAAAENGQLAIGDFTITPLLDGVVEVEEAIFTNADPAARRSLLSYQRSEETAADRSAVKYLEATGQSGKGMLVTFERFQSALSLSGTRG